MHQVRRKVMTQKTVFFFEELEQVFHHIPKYHMKILLGDYNTKGRENIFKLTIGNESLHQDSYDNGIRIVNFGTSKYLVKSMMFLPASKHS
jgi:hypothetical protein